MMDDIGIRTTTGPHKLPFATKYKILGQIFNQAGRTQDSLGEGDTERKQSLMEKL